MNALRELRLRAGFRTKKDLARRLGMPYTTYVSYENKIEPIPIKVAWKMADFFGCSIDEVVGRVPLGRKGLR